MTDHVSMSSLNAIVRFRLPDQVDPPSKFAQFEPFGTNATAITQHSGL
jgi:hypothetical protein